jgi:hypothetical protein
MADIDYLKKNIFPGESGGDYNALFGYSNRPGGQFGGMNLTDLTVDQALAFANPSGPYGQWVKGQVGRVATPMGAYQIVGTTLGAAKKGLGLTGSEKMTPELQDQLGLWIYQTQGPGAWEAWGKGGGGGGQVTTSTKGGAPMNGLLDFPQQDQGGGIMSLLTGEQKPWAGKLNDIGAVLLALSGSPAAAPLLNQIEKRKDRKAEDARANKTMQWLSGLGTPQAMAALQYAQATGDIVGATKMAITPAEVADPGFRTLTPEEVAQLGLPPGAYQMGGDGKISQIGGGGVNVNMPGEAVKVLPDGGVLVVDPSVPDGFRVVQPPGSKAATEAGAAEEQKTAFAETAQDSINLIDSIIKDPALPSITGMVQGRIPPLSQAGTNLVAKIEQVQGQAFLQAFESLKGGGAITEREGLAAQNAIARLQRTQDDKSYIAALNDLKAILERGKRRATAGVKASEGDIYGGGAVIDGVTVGEGF